MKKNKIIERRLSEYFEKEKYVAKDIFNQLSLFIYSIEDSTSDLYNMAKILPDEHLEKLINYYDGAIIKIPTKEKFKEALLLSLLFYFYEIKKLSWSEIKEIIDYDTYFKDYSLISLGKKIIKIRKIINKEMIGILQRLDIKTVLEDVIK